MVVKLAVDKPLVVNGKEELVQLSVEVYSALFVQKKYRLRKREFEFFVGCVLAFNEKIDLRSDEFVNFMHQKTKFSESEKYITNMRYVLCKKRWLMPTKSSYDIPVFFKGGLTNLLINLEVKIKSNGI